MTAISLKVLYPCSILTEEELASDPYLNPQSVETTATDVEMTTETLQKHVQDYIEMSCKNSVELIRPSSGAYGHIHMQYKLKGIKGEQRPFFAGWLSPILKAAQKDSGLCLTPDLQTIRQLTWKPEIRAYVLNQLNNSYRRWLTTVPGILEL